MTHRHSASALAIGVVLASACFAESEKIIEVSPDGQITVELPAIQAPAIGARLSDEVPYPATPDQEVELRRQIGGVIVVDMNGDEFDDVVAVIYTSNSFPPYTEFQDQIYYGGPAGIELTPSWLSDQATHTGDVQVGDVNGDTFPDIVTIHGGAIRADNVRIYFGSASGPSTAPGFTSNSSPRAWGTAGILVNIDGDEDLDLATTNQGLSPDPFRPNFVYRNDGSNLGTQPVWMSSGTELSNGIDAADVNGDGRMDLAVAKGSGFLSGIYLGTPSGLPELTPSITENPGDPDATNANRNALFFDADGDETKELFFNGDPGILYTVTAPLLTQTGYATNPPFNSPQETRAFDVDGDGDLDLADVHFSDGSAHIYLNRGGTLDSEPSWTFDASEVGTSLDFGDVNGDGIPDLVIGYAGNTSLRVFFGIDSGPDADLNDDGAVDSKDVSVLLETQVDFDGSGTFDFADVIAWLLAAAE